MKVRELVSALVRNAWKQSISVAVPFTGICFFSHSVTLNAFSPFFPFSFPFIIFFFISFWRHFQVVKNHDLGNGRNWVSLVTLLHSEEEKAGQQLNPAKLGFLIYKMATVLSFIQYEWDSITSSFLPFGYFLVLRDKAALLYVKS